MSFSRYNVEDSVISSEIVVRGLWSGDTNLLSSFSTQSGYTEYYVDVHKDNTLTALQFSIQYGHLNGSGSSYLNQYTPGYTPSRIVYGEYRNLVYGTETTNFSFDGGITTAEQIYVININRDRYKQALQPGSFNLTLTSGSGANNKVIHLTDDSNTTSTTRFIGENKIYYVISGSNGSAYTSSAATGPYYGMILPDMGIIILDASGSLAPFISASTTTPNTRANNFLRLYTSIVSGASAVGPLIPNGFRLQSQEVVSSRFFFTRIKNSEFNYTSNPSIIDNNGNLLYTALINNPQTFITTVGMYNDNNELLAVAKLSKPLTKDFTKEALIRIKLDY